MRPEAVNIILDYMALYSEEPELVVSQNDFMIEKDSSQTIYLYGTLVWDNEEPYQIIKPSSIADAQIGIDDNGIYFLNITGIESGSSSIEVINSDGKSAVINFDVIPKGVTVPSDIPETGYTSDGLIFGICAVATALGTYADKYQIRNRQN